MTTKVQVNSLGQAYITGAGKALVGTSGSPVITSLNVTPTTSAQVINVPSGTDGYAPVNVGAVTSSIDANITAGNIKKDVTILGVTGTYEGGGGSSDTIVVPASDLTFVQDELDLDGKISTLYVHKLPSGVSDIGFLHHVNACFTSEYEFEGQTYYELNDSLEDYLGRIPICKPTYSGTNDEHTYSILFQDCWGETGDETVITFTI